jgi:anaphase-promoting complex subunit 1
MSTLTFSRDRRVQEVCRLLDSSQKMRLPPIADFDQLDELGRTAKHQEDLVAMCRRALALPTGRGMLTLGLCPPVATEVQPVPPMTLEAVAGPSGSMVKLDLNQAKELHDMARFHNGCAAALRLAPGVKNVTRTWVLYNKTQSARSGGAAAARGGAMTDDEKAAQQKQERDERFEHAGFLLGLGLHGHLKVLTRPDSLNYLAPQHDATTVGLLLGHAAGQRCSADRYIFKMLAIFLPSLLGADVDCHYDPLPSPMVQTAAILGVGLLYQQTPNRDIISYLIGQVRSHFFFVCDGTLLSFCFLISFFM